LTLLGSYAIGVRKRLSSTDQQTNVGFCQLLPVLLNSGEERGERLGGIIATISLEMLPFSQNQRFQNRKVKHWIKKEGHQYPEQAQRC